MDRRTYWCHQCDMSISLIPTTLTTSTTTNTTSCPHCTSDVLAELDSPFTFHTQNNNLNNNQNDTSLIFDSPYFHHVISHLFNNSFDQSSYGHDDNNDDHMTSGTASEQNKVLALSKGDINGIKSVKITAELLGNDPVVICAVCKELFEIDDDVKELPCKHMYHPGCIIPWLLIRNSCPLCRFEMPVQEEEEGRELKVRRRRSSSSVLRGGEDFMDDDDEYDGEEELFGFGLRHLARRHRLIFPMTRNDELQQRRVEEEILFTLGRIGEEEVEVGDSGRTGNVDTGSSWPNWPVVDGGEIGMGSASVNDDVDVVIS